MTLTIEGIEGLLSRSGSHLGESRWVTVDQARVTDFGELTLDRNPLHVDPEVARAAGFDGTIVHGFLTLSLIGGLLGDVFTVHGVSSVLNYGLNRVRFPDPMPTGGRVRLSIELEAVAKAEAYADATLQCTIAAAGASRPVCVADLVLRFYA